MRPARSLIPGLGAAASLLAAAGAVLLLAGSMFAFHDLRRAAHPAGPGRALIVTGGPPAVPRIVAAAPAGARGAAFAAGGRPAIAPRSAGGGNRAPTGRSHAPRARGGAREPTATPPSAANLPPTPRRAAALSGAVRSLTDAAAAGLRPLGGALPVAAPAVASVSEAIVATGDGAASLLDALSVSRSR